MNGPAEKVTYTAADLPALVARLDERSAAQALVLKDIKDGVAANRRELRKHARDVNERLVALEDVLKVARAVRRIVGWVLAIGASAAAIAVAVAKLWPSKGG